MEGILHRVIPCDGVCFTRNRIPSRTHVHRTIEIAILRTGTKRILMAQLDQICLAASRPAYLIEVIAHLPESRPKTVRRLRELNTRIDTTEGIIHIPFAVHTTGCAILAQITLFRRCQNETLFTRRRFCSYRHSLLAIVLQLVIATAVVVHLYIPNRAVQTAVRKVLVPNQFILPCSSAAGFIRRCAGRSIIG